MSNEKKDIGLFFIYKIIIGVIGLLLVTFYSSLIDPSDYGDYSLISGFVSALISIFIGWIGSSSLRYYIDYEKYYRDMKFSGMTVIEIDYYTYMYVFY